MREVAQCRLDLTQIPHRATRRGTAYVRHVWCRIVRSSTTGTGSPLCGLLSSTRYLRRTFEYDSSRACSLRCGVRGGFGWHGGGDAWVEEEAGGTGEGGKIADGRIPHVRVGQLVSSLCACACGLVRASKLCAGN